MTTINQLQDAIADMAKQYQGELAAKDLEIERLRKLCEEILGAFETATFTSSGSEPLMALKWRSQLNLNNKE